MDDDINHKIHGLIEHIHNKLIETGEVLHKLELSTKQLVPDNEISKFLKEFEVKLEKRVKDDDRDDDEARDDEARDDEARDDEVEEQSDKQLSNDNDVNDNDIINKMIDQLESQRIKLVMDIQQEDYLKDKLLELITHNAEMILSVKEYLENKSGLIQEDYKLVNDRFKTYIQQIKLKLTNLQFNNYEMQKNFKRIETLIDHIELNEVTELNKLINYLNHHKEVVES